MSVVASVAINVDAANAITQLNRVKTETGGTEKELKKAIKTAQGFGAALQSALGPLLTITAAIGVANKALSVFGERQADIAVLSNGLKGLVPDVEKATDVLKIMADEFGKATLFSEEDFIKGAQMLTSFRSIAVSSYQEVINTAGDVAQVMGTDVNGALLQLAKALQDPVLGLTALSRSGIQFTESQKETIKSMVTAGNAAGAQALILQELKTQYGGAALAAGNAGLAGVLDGLAEASNDTFEALGKIIQPALIAGTQLLTAAFNALRQNLPIIQAAATTLLAPLTAIASVILPALSQGVGFIINNIKGFIQVATFIGTFLGTLKAIVLITQAWTAATQALATAKKGAAVAAAALQAIANPSNLAKIAVAIAGAAAASYALGKAMDQAAQETKATQDESQKLLGSVDQILGKYQQTPAVLNQVLNSSKEITAEHKHQAELLKSALDIESQRITQAASYVEARSQAEIAVNDVILQRLEYELKSAQTQNERISLAQQIYRIEVANAEATYRATVARINAQTKLVELAVREQEAKRLALEVEKAIALQKNQDVRQLERAIQLQTQAVQLARENLSYTKAIAAEQLRGADATFRAAEQAARLKAETAAAAQAAARYANNISAAVSASAPASSGISGGGSGSGSGSGGGGGIPAILGSGQGNSASLAEYGSFTPLGAVKDLERRLREYDELRSYGIKAEMPRIEGYLATKGPTFRKNYPALTLKNEYVELDAEMRRVLEIALAKYQAQNKDTTYTNPQVNIRTGPVMQMDGINYVSQQDLVSATQTAARQGARMALDQLERDPGTRRRVGVMR